MRQIEAGMAVMVLDRVPGVVSPVAKKYIGTRQVVEGSTASGESWYLVGVEDIGPTSLSRIFFPSGDLEPIAPEGETG